MGTELVASGGEVVSTATSGWQLLAKMPQEAFDTHLSEMSLARVRVQAIQKSVMVEGAHYGKVEGIAKPFLHQPGAEVLCQMLHLVPEFKRSIEYGDGVTKPHVIVVVECLLHYGDAAGPIVGTGGGGCTSWEKKYRYRSAGRVCPKCNRDTIMKSKNRGWFCWAKKGGCGTQWQDDNAPEIINQPLGSAENPDPFDQLNTYLGMADKRAYVKATRTTTATSDLFTQDDDIVPPQPGTSTGSHDDAAPATNGNRTNLQEIKDNLQEIKDKWWKKGGACKTIDKANETLAEARTNAAEMEPFKAEWFKQFCAHLQKFQIIWNGKAGKFEQAAQPTAAQGAPTTAAAPATGTQQSTPPQQQQAAAPTPQPAMGSEPAQATQPAAAPAQQPATAPSQTQRPADPGDDGIPFSFLPFALALAGTLAGLAGTVLMS